ncbi:MAG TPA: hypothetical protein VMU36_13800 [Spirochaetia bacterium]|nr:hypothetical protein [Spirochaetia bacterium]
MKSVRAFFLACLVVALGGCYIIPHAVSIQERTTLTPDKSYVGGIFLTNMTEPMVLYMDAPNDNLVAIDLYRGGLFLVELPPGQYRVHHLWIYSSSEPQGIYRVIPELSRQHIMVSPGQVTYLGHLGVAKNWLIFETRYETRYAFDRMEFEALLGSSYDVPPSVAIVGAAK